MRVRHDDYPDAQSTGIMNQKLVNNSLKRIILISFVLMTTVTLFANNNEHNLNRTISREQAIDDLNLYFQIIDGQHGNPYQYISRTDFISSLNQSISELPEEINFKDFDVLLSKLNNQIRCGHTTISLESDLLKAETSIAQFFPYPVKFIDGALYIDFEKGDLPHASKVEAINGQTISTVVSELTSLAVTDGFSETKLIREIESRFGYYYFLRYGASSTFEVDYEADQRDLSASIAGVTGNEMLVNNYYRPVYLSHERYHKFTHLDAIDSLQTLVLTLNTFQANPDWFFKRISSRYNEESKEFDFDNLVVDLRNNEGGDRRLLSILYQFLAGEKLYDPSKTTIKSRDILFKDHLYAVNGSFKSEQTLERAEDYLKEHFISTHEDGFSSDLKNWYDTFDAGIHWTGERFEGKIYVLTSGKTFSAAADLARILSQMNNAVLIGEETGGAHVGRTANMLLNYKLPNTSTIIQVPVIYEEFVQVENKTEGRGTFPDFLIQETVEDLISKQDAALNYAFNLIQQQTTYGSN